MDEQDYTCSSTSNTGMACSGSSNRVNPKSSRDSIYTSESSIAGINKGNGFEKGSILVDDQIRKTSNQNSTAGYSPVRSINSLESDASGSSFSAESSSKTSRPFHREHRTPLRRPVRHGKSRHNKHTSWVASLLCVPRVSGFEVFRGNKDLHTQNTGGVGQCAGASSVAVAGPSGSSSFNESNINKEGPVKTISFFSLSLLKKRKRHLSARAEEKRPAPISNEVVRYIPQTKCDTESIIEARISPPGDGKYRFITCLMDDFNPDYIRPIILCCDFAPTFLELIMSLYSMYRLSDEERIYKVLVFLKGDEVTFRVGRTYDEDWNVILRLMDQENIRLRTWFFVTRTVLPESIEQASSIPGQIMTRENRKRRVGMKNRFHKADGRLQIIKKCFDMAIEEAVEEIQISLTHLDHSLEATKDVLKNTVKSLAKK